MILKGSQRMGASQLADHLMNERDNDHVTLLELRGFVSDNLHGALFETYAISKATMCKQYMFSLSLNPPKDHIASEQDFMNAADQAEAKLGLNGQPRAIVIHEKEGRGHAHVVWSRIDTDIMKAINLPHYKRKLTDLSRDLFLDHGWQLPDGLATYGNKSPLNFTLDEWQQAKRQGVDPREIKQEFQQAWERCDSQLGFSNALEDRGYFLARGDRRGFVALDIYGNVYSIPKWTGLKTKDVKTKLGSPEDLPSVDETQKGIRSKVSDQMRDYIGQIKDRQTRDMEPIRAEHRAMKQAHRAERKHLQTMQDQRWLAESNARSERLNKGMRGLFDWVSGKAKATNKQNEQEAYQDIVRDSNQRHDLVKAQMGDRQVLQNRFDKIRSKQKQDRKIFARDVSQSLRRQSKTQSRPITRDRNRDLDLTI